MMWTAFERSTAGHIPENALLSHDLLEGLMGRAGLVTDITMVEDYPPNYFVQITPPAPLDPRRLAAAALAVFGRRAGVEACILLNHRPLEDDRQPAPLAGSPARWRDPVHPGDAGCLPARPGCGRRLC